MILGKGNKLKKINFGTAIFLILLLIETWCFYFYIFDFDRTFATDTEKYRYYTRISIYFFAVTIFLWLLCRSLKTADQWEKAVVLRMGKYRGLKGPGFFFIIPIFDKVDKFIDQRVRVTSFGAEKTLTKDTVPVNVDAVAYWTVWDAEKTALEVQEYVDAVTYAAQTGLRDIIGKHELADLLQNREKIAGDIQHTLDEQTNPWGITCQSVGIRDIVIPADLSDAMSKQAQAERERQARIILGTAETEISEKFEQASERYRDNPIALQLRGMNMLFEGLKEKGSLIIVPSSALESMNLGAVSGLAALNEQATTKDKGED
ncbi:MAG: slipin family protein [Proteobacteria bacterium]|nr:slipin family protein [Pseudomonadota bacterium]